MFLDSVKVGGAVVLLVPVPVQAPPPVQVLAPVHGALLVHDALLAHGAVPVQVLARSPVLEVGGVATPEAPAQRYVPAPNQRKAQVPAPVLVPIIVQAPAQKEVQVPAPVLVPSLA